MAENPSYPISFTHFVTGTTGGSFISHFEMEDKGVTFGAEYSHIKASITDMNEEKESRWITQGGYKQSFWRQWIPTVQTFAKLWGWGKNMVINSDI